MNFENEDAYTNSLAVMALSFISTTIIRDELEYVTVDEVIEWLNTTNDILTGELIVSILRDVDVITINAHDEVRITTYGQDTLNEMFHRVSP